MIRRGLLMAVLGLGACEAAPFRQSAASADGATLIDAARKGDLITTWAALQAGVPPNSHDRAGNSALTFAARDGQEQIASLLIAYGASVDWQDGEQVTPLILAALNNYPGMAALLLKEGADPEIRDRFGRTALDYARRRGTDDPIAIMLETKASDVAGDAGAAY